MGEANDLDLLKFDSRRRRKECFAPYFLIKHTLGMNFHPALSFVQLFEVCFKH